MATRGSNKPGSKDYGKVKFRGFVNVYLRPEHKASIKENLPTAETVLQFLDTCATSDLKFSLSYSDKGGFYTATVYCTDFKSPNAGLSLSLRHSDISTAIGALIFVLDMVGITGSWEEEWGEVGSSNDW